MPDAPEDKRLEVFRMALADSGWDPRRAMRTVSGVLAYAHSPALSDERLMELWRAFRIAEPANTAECFGCWMVASAATGVDECPEHSGIGTIDELDVSFDAFGDR